MKLKRSPTEEVVFVLFGFRDFTVVPELYPVIRFFYYLGKDLIEKVIIDIPRI